MTGGRFHSSKCPCVWIELNLLWMELWLHKFRVVPMTKGKLSTDQKKNNHVPVQNIKEAADGRGFLTILCRAA